MKAILTLFCSFISWICCAQDLNIAKILEVNGIPFADIIQGNPYCISDLSEISSIEFKIGKLGSNLNFSDYNFGVIINGQRIERTTRGRFTSQFTIAKVENINYSISGPGPLSFEVFIDHPDDVGITNNTRSFQLIIDPETETGSIVADTEICESDNRSELMIQNNIGEIVQWEILTSAGQWVSTNEKSSSVPIDKNIVNQIHRVKVKSGACSSAYTPEHTLQIVAESQGGQLNDLTYCNGANQSVELVLANNNGEILQWEKKETGSSWNTISSTIAELQIQNLNNTTFYRALVQNSVCPSVYSSEATVKVVNQSNSGNIFQDTSVCVGDSVKVFVKNYQADFFIWQISKDGTNFEDHNIDNSEFKFKVEESVHVRVKTSVRGCPNTSLSSYVIITAKTPPVLLIDDKISVQQGEQVQLNVSGASTYKWTPELYLDDALSSSPICRPIEGISYTVVGESDFGCTSEINVDVELEEDYDNFTSSDFPNTIIRGSQMGSDVWKIENLEAYPNAKLSIFSPYGKTVFQADPYLNDWKGTSKGRELENGSYFYVLQLREGSKKIQGSITIIGQ